MKNVLSSIMFLFLFFFLGLNLLFDIGFMCLIVMVFEELGIDSLL
jgi:hypothetical protein